MAPFYEFPKKEGVDRNCPLFTCTDMLVRPLSAVPIRKKKRIKIKIPALACVSFTNLL